MAKVFSQNDRSNDHTVRKLGILFAIALLVIVPAGAAGNEDLQVMDRATGTTNNAKLGWNITNIGDVNNDNNDDYAIGAPGMNSVLIFHGPIVKGFSISSPNLRINGPASSNFGWSVAGVGDYDRNNRDDIIIGAPSISKAYVFKGGSTGTLSQANANIVLEGVTGDMFGHGVAGIDYGNTTNIYAAVGAPRDEHFLPSAGTNVKTGAVFLFNLTYLNSKSITSVNTTLANLTFQGEQNNGWFGFTVANLGNINGDLNGDDLGIGDPYFHTTGDTDNGALHIQYSKNILIEIPVIPSASMDGFIHGRSNSRFGWFVRGVGDVSPSPEDDFIVGAPIENFVGHAHLFFGTTSSIQITLSATIGPDHEFTGINPGDRFGWYADRTMISGASPVTITVGAPGYDNVTGTQMTDSGALFSFWDYGAVVNATNAKSKIYGDAAGNNLGYALCEVYYRASTEGDIRIMASSPYHGSGDTGKIEIMRRNQLPAIKQLFCNPTTGNLDTLFTLSINYSDPEGDMPSWIEVTVYQDQAGTQPLQTFRFNQSVGTDHTKGVIYEVVTKLPNSILDKSTANKPLYMDARTRAVRGSRDIVKSQGGIVPGPVVDGVPPSAPEIISATGEPGNNLDEGTFKFTFEWPEEDEGFLNTLGKVKKLYIALREGKRNTITEANWYDMNDEGDEFNLSTGKTVIYRIMQFNDIETPFTRTNDYIIGENDLRTNPNGIKLKKMENYTIALRAEDEEGNVGPISNVVEVQTYWRRPEIPPEMETLLMDVGEDDGGTLLVKWVPEASMIHPEDLTEYWIYVDTMPRGNISDFDEEPDHIITRADDYDTFLDRMLYITDYLDETGKKVDLADGQGYYAAVLGVNWLGQHCGILQWSSPEEVVINDNETSIAMIKNVNGENYGNDGHQIRLTWSKTNDPKFVEYQIFGREYSYNKIDDAARIATITDASTTELIIKDIDGATISQAYEYSFTVLVKDYNRHIIEDVDPVNNTVRGVKTIAVREEGDVPPQVRGVSLQDKGNDGGGVLQLSWFQQLQTMETSDGNPVGFWQYNVYFSDEPITDLAGMEPYTVKKDLRDNSMEISQFEGEPLIDGKPYYAAVTTVDFDLVENRELDKNNVDSDRPINQSDTTAPSYPIQNFRSSSQSLTNITLSWTAVTEEQVQDFNYYWLQWTGKRAGKWQIDNRLSTSYVIEGLERGSEYWVNISIVDLTGNIGSIHPSIKIYTAGNNTPPVIDQINIDINEENFNLTNGGSKSINKADAYIVFFTGTAHDDWTSFNRLIWKWNISTPTGQYIEKNFRSWDLEIAEPGDYTITLIVGDDEGEWSDPWTITFTVDPVKEDDSILVYILIPVLILVFLVAVVVVIFVLMSGKKSQQKQMLEQYEERRKDIQTMEPIYTNLPTWTCDCGATQVPLSKNAYCNSCYQSHEAVPITGLDEYLKEHDLVLAEMKVDIPPGWQGQDLAIENAKKDLEERKERALKSLNEEFAIWLKGTQYESEIPAPEEAPAEAPAEEGAPKAPLYHHGAIIPGQSPPGGPLQPAPMTPGPMRPMPMGPQPPMQPRPVQPGMPQPIRPPVPGQPLQRPPQKPQQ